MNKMANDSVLESCIIPLQRYCRETGFSLRYIRNVLYGEDAGLRRRFIESGAVIRSGGRWYVHAKRLASWALSETLAWSDSQPH